MIAIFVRRIERENMSKAGDLIEYSRNDDDIERLYKFLKDIIYNYFETSSETIENLSEEDIKELAKYFRYFLRTHGEKALSCDVSINKMKAFFLLFSKLSDDENADRIMGKSSSIN